MAIKQKPSRVKKWFLAIGIAIIFVMFVNYTASALFNRPEYNKFCPSDNRTVINLTNKADCIAKGGQWTETNDVQYPAAAPTVPVKVVGGYCNPDFTCSNAYTKAQEKYDSNAFITKIIAGFVALILGVVLASESVSAGFLLGAVLTLFFATVQYWERFNDIIRVIILGIVLVILVWLGYKKIR